MEKGMLYIVATLNEFHSMLVDAKVHVFTYHKNLTFGSIKIQRALHWRNKIDEFTPILHYIKGPKNILADSFSIFKRLIVPAQLGKGKNLVKPACVTDKEGDNDTFFFKQACSGVYDKDIQ
eukprot:8567486-Ditylum_brightwellii.AAC.1